MCQAGVYCQVSIKPGQGKGAGAFLLYLNHAAAKQKNPAKFPQHIFNQKHNFFIN